MSITISRSLLALLPILVACGDDDGRSGRTMVRDSAGVTIVESESPAWSGTRWQIGATPLLRIGVSGTDPAEQFSYVEGVARLRDGTIVVADGESAEIRWFDSTGTHLVTRGGRGRGPGEFTSLAQLVKLAGDTLLAQNMPMLKQVLYGSRGELLREETVDYPRYRSFGRWLECYSLTLPDRSLLGCQAEPGLNSGVTETPGHLRTHARYIRVPWTMDGAYRLGIHGGLEQWGVRTARGGMAYGMHPFHARTVVGAGADSLRVAIALNPEYSIEVWSPDGRLEHIVRRIGARRAPTPAQVTEARDRLRRWSSRQPGVYERLLAEMEEPDSIPAVYNLAFGPGGDLWVTRDPYTSTQTVDVDVFDREGRFLGTLQLPYRFRLMEVGIDYLLGVRYDENDVPIVELYSLTRT